MLINPCHLGRTAWAHIHGPLIQTPTIADLVAVEDKPKPRSNNPFYAKAKGLPSSGKKANPFYNDRWNW